MSYRPQNTRLSIIIAINKLIIKMIKKILTSIVAVLLISTFCYSQNEPLTISNIIQIEDIKKDSIFYYTMLWCSESFKDSKNAINVTDKEAGLIAGKATYISKYKIPRKKDSVDGYTFSRYSFDWRIEIKDNKLKYTIINPSINLSLNSTPEYYPVYLNSTCPVVYLFISKKKTDIEWNIANDYFAKNITYLFGTIKDYINKNKQTNW